jgi:hypothetical protein
VRVMSDPDRDAKYRELLAQTSAHKDTGKEGK